MTFVDSHTHLFAEEFDDDREATVQRALDAGVEKLFLPNIDYATVTPMMDMVKKWPRHCFPMLGLHPCSVTADYEQQLDKLQEILGSGEFCAIGETGLDFYWDTTFKKEQILSFDRQIDWALNKNLPIVIHTRHSIDEGVSMISDKQNGRLRGVFHCFNGTPEQAERIIRLGFYIGVGGVSTFKNGHMEPILEAIGLENILLETDSPFLAPTPYRGKRNESAYIPLIAQKIADVKKTALSEVARVTTENSLTLFQNNHHS